MTGPALAFSIARDRLAAAVNRVAKVIQKRNTMPILGHILLRAEGGAVTLRGTDLDVDAVIRVDGAAIGKAGAAAVPAAEFAASLAKWPDGTLTIESDGRRLTARIARSRATLPVLPEEDFPDIKHGEAAHRFELPGVELMTIAERCGFAISTDEVRYYLNGIYLHADDRNLRAAATDGHRLSRFEIPLPEGAGGMHGVIIPRRTIDLWPQLLGKHGNDPVRVEASSGFIRFTTDLMTLHSKVIDGTYPDLERVIPRGNNQVALSGLADITAAVDRLLVYRAGAKNRALRLTFGDGHIVLTIRSDAGEAEETIVAECDFDLEIAFNGQYLRDMLATMTGPKIRLEMGDPRSPPLITDEADPRRVIVLMPMRA